MKLDSKISYIRSKEHGFTLLELIVVIVIISILTTFAVVIMGNQQRAAAISTVQHDVRNSVTNIINENKANDLKTEQQFISRATITQGNIVGAKIDNSAATQLACIWGLHQFSATDIYVYHYSSQKARFEEGPCSGDKPTDLLSQGSANPSNPNTSTAKDQINNGGGTTNTTTGSNGNTTKIDDENLKPYTDGTVTYSPRYQYNSYGGNSATIYIDITSSSTSLVNWDYKANLAKAPYWGATQSEISYNDGQGTISYTTQNLRIKNVNINNGVSTTRSITITYNLNKFTPPDILEMYKVEVSPSSSNSQWWACVEVRVTSESITPITWSATLDLKDYFKSISGKTPNFTNLKNVKQSDTIYKITGNSTNSDTVSKDHPIYNSQTICYSPNGSPW